MEPGLLSLPFAPAVKPYAYYFPLSPSLSRAMLLQLGDGDIFGYARIVFRVDGRHAAVLVHTVDPNGFALPRYFDFIVR